MMKNEKVIRPAGGESPLFLPYCSNTRHWIRTRLNRRTGLARPLPDGVGGIQNGSSCIGKTIAVSINQLGHIPGVVTASDEGSTGDLFETHMPGQFT